MAFDGLEDAAAFREPRRRFGKREGVRDGAKREQQEFAEQSEAERGYFFRAGRLCVRKARAPTCAAKSSGKSPTCAIARNMRRTRKSSSRPACVGRHFRPSYGDWARAS